MKIQRILCDLLLVVRSYMPWCCWLLDYNNSLVIYWTMPRASKKDENELFGRDSATTGGHSPNVTRKYKKQLLVPSLRKESLTGSLPDLTNLAVCNNYVDGGRFSPRRVLPKGSEAFQSVLQDLKNEATRKRRNSNIKLSLKLNDNNLVQKFRSRTAQVICMNR